MRKIAIWAAGGNKVGGGHATRMAALAKTVARTGVEVDFIVGADAAAILADRIRNTPLISIAIVPDFAEMADAVAAAGYEWVVIDDYAIGADQESRIRRAGSRVLAVDDLADRSHDCDILLDAMPYRQDSHYVGLVPKDAKLLIGLEYALVNAEFLELRAQSLARREVPKLGNVVATFGLSANIEGATRVLEAFVLSGIDARLTVIAGNERVADMLRSNAIGRSIEVRTALADPASVFADADLAILAPGVTTLEMCTLGVPMIQLTTSKHQFPLAGNMAQRSAAVTIESVQSLADRLLSFARNPALLARMSQAAAAAVDGKGTQRTAQRLLTGHCLAQ
ncbi:MAG: UDP-2,4-diacetamido-2,4,6-trideoxy-beta-L-altropyranose hydrolase [Magnetospirillum sp.]|nr:UDP-2,4-diacetamido-2,4,6-trideoxy-beta-L-altropyranose hydrolase [Magnetospirillum sp.]